MTDKTVPYEKGKQQEQAVLLLEAAEKLELDPGVVKTSYEGFVAPEEVVSKAGYTKQANQYEKAQSEVADSDSGEDEKKSSGRSGNRRAAKKTTSSNGG